MRVDFNLTSIERGELSLDKLLFIVSVKFWPFCSIANVLTYTLK